jgi:hypothetical protein
MGADFLTRTSPRPPVRKVSYSVFKGETSSLSAHLDMQMVSLTLRVMSRPDMEHLPKIYQNLGQECVSEGYHSRQLRSHSSSYDERVLPSIGNEVLKATVAQFDGESPPNKHIPYLG